MEQKIHSSYSVVDLFNASPVALIGVSQDEIIVFNRKAQSLFAYPPEEIIGRNLEVLIPECSSEHLESYLEELKDTGSSEMDDTEVVGLFGRDKKGQEFPIRMNLSTSENSEGKVIIVHIEKTEKQRSASRKQFKGLFDQSPYAIALHDFDKITHVNKEFLKLFGYEDDADLIGKAPLKTLVHPDDTPIIDRTRDRLLTSSEKRSIYIPEVKLLLADGKYLLAEAYTSLTMIDKIQHVQIVVRDLTHRKQLEKRLLHSEEKFKGLFDSMSDLFARVTNKGVVDFVSPSVYDMLGYHANDLIGKRAIDFYENSDDRTQLIQEVREKGFCQNFETPVLTKDGVRKILSINAKVYKDENGVAQGIESISRDVTAYKKQEQELINNELILRNFFDLAPIGIALNRMNGEFIEVNAEFSRFTGYSKDELNKLSYWELTPEKYADQEAVMLELLQTRSAYGPYEKEYIHKDGHTYPVLLNGIKIKDSNGEELIWSVVQDITDTNFQKETLQSLATGLTAVRGEEFFKKVSMYLVSSLNVDYAFVGKFNSANLDVSLVGGIYKGEEISPFEYCLQGTPCANVIMDGVCSYPSNVQELFPEDQMLIDMNIEGYIGCPLKDGEGNPIGILVLLKEGPILNHEISKSTLQVFSERVSSEMIRLDSAEKLIESENKLASINENSPDLITTIDKDLRINYINRVAEGYNISDVMGSSIMDFVLTPFKSKYLEYVNAAFNGKNQHFEMEGYGPNAEPAWYSVRMSVMNINKPSMSLLIISTDITSQKKAEIRNKVVNSISNRLITNISLNEFCSFIYSEVQKIKPFPNMYVSNFDESKNEVAVFFDAQNGEIKDVLPEPRIAGNGLSEYVLRTKQGLLLGGEEVLDFQQKHDLKIYGQMAKSWVGVPLIGESKELGVLAVQCFESGRVYSESDLDMLSFIGTQIASFMERSIADKEIKQFEKYFSVSMDLMCIAGTDSYFKKINPKFSEVLGYSNQELLSRSFIDFIHPDDREASLKEVEKLSQGHTTIDFINRYLCSNGEYKNFLWTAAFDQPTGAIYAAARDITEQVKSQEILAALTGIQDAFIDNKSSKESFGNMLRILLEITQSEYGFIAEVLHDGDEQPYLKTQAILSDSWSTETSEYYRENYSGGVEFKKLNTLLGRAILTGKPVISDNPDNEALKEELPKELPEMRDYMGIPFYYKDVLIGMVGLANKPKGYNDRDVHLLDPFMATCSTLLNAHQNSIKRLNIEKEASKLADIVSYSVDAIISTDRDASITSWNKGAEKLLDYSSKEMIGENMADLLQDSEQENTRLIESTLNGNSMENYETVMRKKCGELIDVSLSIFPLIGEEGKVRGISGIIRDISDQKEAQEIKEEFTRSLEIKVKERTKDLEDAQQQLTISLLKEKELNDLKSQFVSIASHQFRTPLAVINASIALLDMQKEQMDTVFKTTFEKVNVRIRSQIDRMTNLMDDVLTVSKINEGIVQPKLVPVDVVELCREISQNYNEIQSDNRKISFAVKGESRFIELDKDLMGHALSNLISNALKYSPGAESPVLTVSFSKKNVQISVKDYGIGIPKQDLKGLFEPFYRASNIGEISGTGLGTSIAKEYVLLNHGTISVKSELGKGTEFVISFQKS